MASTARFSKATVVASALVFIFVVVYYIPYHQHASALSRTKNAATEEALADLQAGLEVYAHRIPSAEDFVPYFDTVLELPNITLEDAKASCHWDEPERVNFQFEPTADWNVNDRPSEEINKKREQWQTYIRDGFATMNYSQYQNRFVGRGIVIIAGNEQTIMRVQMLLKALNRLGSQLSVEIHYYDQELNDTIQQNLTSLRPDISFIDLSSPTNVVQVTPGLIDGRNYHFKTAALLNSHFAEPLMLDADNIPIIDPVTLYDTPLYSEYGSIFWPDISRTRPTNPIWAITNTACTTTEYEQESGQLLVDKRRFFYHLLLAHFFASDAFYYGQILLGDKDLFRFAWHALKTRYGFPPKWVTSVGTLNDGYYCGHTFAQHHPDGRAAFMHAGLLKMMDVDVMRWQKEVNGGVWQVYKQWDEDGDRENGTLSRIKFDNAEYVPAESKNGPGRVGWCVDFDEVTARPLQELVPGFESFFEEIGGYWPIEAG